MHFNSNSHLVKYNFCQANSILTIGTAVHLYVIPINRETLTQHMAFKDLYTAL